MFDNKDKKEEIDLSSISDDMLEFQIDGLADDIGDIDEFNELLADEDLDIELDEDSLTELNLIDTQLNIMNSNNEQTNKLAMIMGIDTSSGRTSRGLIDDLTKYTIGIEEEEEDEELEINIPKEFDSAEINRLREMLTGIILFHNNVKVMSRAKDIEKQLSENNNFRNQAKQAKIKFEEEGKLIKSNFEVLKQKLIALDKHRKKEKLTKAEQFIVNNTSMKDIEVEIHDNKKNLANINNQITQLISKINTYNRVEEEIINEIKTLQNSNTNEVRSETVNYVNEVMAKTKKVVKVQFGGEMYSHDFRETKVAVMCSCGHVNICDYAQLPYYFSGDIYGNFKERSYINNNVSKNFYSARGKIKQTETRTKLHREENIVDRRIEFPGVTDKSTDALTCQSCKSYLMFTPDVVDKLVDRGFIIDEFTAELANSGLGKYYDISQGVRVYLHDNEVSRRYKGDLGLFEYKVAKISTNIKDTDKYERATLGKITRIDEKALLNYAGFNSAEGVDMKQLEEDFLSHVSNIRLAIKEIKSGIKPRKAKDTMTKEQKAKVEKFNLQRARILNFLHSNEGLIIKYAIDNRMSSQALKNLVANNTDNLTELKSRLYEFLVDYLLDSVINRKPTFIFEEGSARTINHKEIVLPHTNFFDCYRPIIKDFLMNEIKHIKSNVDLVNYYNIFRKLSVISRIKGDDELKIRKSEEFVRDFRKTLGSFYEIGKFRLFGDYLNNRVKLESNFDLNAKCFAWLYYEMITQNKAIKNTEVQDTELFQELYGQELEEKGNFFYFQINK